MAKVKNLFVVDEATVISNVQLQDRISVPTQRTLTDAGQMHVPCKFARTGSQLYTAKQLGLTDVAPDKVITVYRDEADVFDAASMESFRSAPVTIGHPKNAAGLDMKLTADNSKELQVGMLEGMPTRDEDTLAGMLVLTSKEAIDALEDGTQELSAGYAMDLELVGDKYYQRNIRANHIAIVPKGRAGSSCRISDEAELNLTDAYEALQVEMTDAVAAVKVELADAKEALVKAETSADAAKTIIADAKAKAEASDLELEGMKVELADAKVAASEGVVERCQVMEDARLIADMRDLGEKSVSEIRRLVVDDQMEGKDLTDKSDAYIEAMFEILVDASKGETPMGKLIKQADTHVTVDAKHVDPVKTARQKMIDKQKGQKEASSTY